MTSIEFKAYPKTQRLSNEIITISEKIDGSNGVLYVDHTSRTVMAGSRSRWLEDDGTKSWDNHGFGAWVKENEEKLLNLPEGYHYGEWYGKGINRNYGLKDRRFMLFNLDRYIRFFDETDLPKELEPETVVALLTGDEDLHDQLECIQTSLKENGSLHVPGFKSTEGIILRFRLSAKVYKVVWDK